MDAALNVLESFLGLVHNTADIAQASPAERMVVSARASSALFFSQYFFHDQGPALIFQDISYYVFLRISETVADAIFHYAVPRDTSTYIPAFFSTGVISSYG